MKTTVGGGCTAGGCARRGIAAKSKAVAARHNETLNEHNMRSDFPAGVKVIRIKVDFSEETTSLLCHRSASGIYNRER
jgi:hypothetical protein